MPDCPTCGKYFDSKKSVNYHHYPAHDFSIALEESNCESCGSVFEYYPSDKKGIYCSDCADNSWGSENLDIGSGKDNTQWKGGKIETNCANCNKIIRVRRANHRNYDNNFCDKSCVAEYNSEKFTGEGNPRYIDGEHKQRNYSKGWKKAKNKALKRDNSRCVVCNRGEEELGRNPSVHHKKPVRTFDNPEDAHYLDNLVCLCPKHHQEVESDNRKI